MKKIFILFVMFGLVSCIAQSRAPRLTDWDGSSQDSWQVGKNGGQIKFNNDSLNYYIKYKVGASWDSTRLIGSKNPRGNHIWQDIVGRKWFKTILRADTLETKYFKLQDGATDIETMGSGDIRISNGSYPNYISWILYYGQNGLGGRLLDSLAHLRYMRESGSAKYLTGLRPTAPTDTGKALFFGNGGTWSLRTIAAAHAAVTETITGIDLTGQALSLTAGYSIPQDTSITNWRTAYAMRHSAITETITAIDLTGQALSLASGYYIPTTTDQTNWNAKITLASLSGVSPISYNNSTGAISFLTNTDISWTGNHYYNGTGTKTYFGSGHYFQLPNFAGATGGMIKYDSTPQKVYVVNNAGSDVELAYQTNATIPPSSNTADNIPLWNGANSKTLKDGLAFTSLATPSTIVGRDGSGDSKFRSIYASSYLYLGTASTTSGIIYLYDANSSYNMTVLSNMLTTNRVIFLPDATGDVPLLQTSNPWTNTNEFQADLKLTDDFINVWEAATVSGDTLYTTGKTSMTTSYDGDISVIAGGVDGKEILLMSTSVITSLSESGNIVNLPSGSVGFNQYGIARFKYYASAGKWVCIGVENN